MAKVRSIRYQVNVHLDILAVAQRLTLAGVQRASLIEIDELACLLATKGELSDQDIASRLRPSRFQLSASMRD